MLLENCFSTKKVNTKRQIEIDIVKAICIIGMVLVHTLEAYKIELAGNTMISTTFDYLVIIVFDGLFGASSFMFCMGVGTVFSKRNSPNQIIKHGFIIFVVAYVLNVFRALLPISFAYWVTGDKSIMDGILLRIFSNDILNFAGLALILFGLIKKLKKYSDIVLVIVAVSMSVIGSIFRMLDFENAGINTFLGLFLGTIDSASGEAFAFFPLFNWFIFVVAGYYFGKMIMYCKDRTKFYLKVSTLSFVIVIVYVCIAIPLRLGMMNYDINYLYQITTLEAIVCIFATLFVLGLYYFLSKVLPSFIVRFFERLSKKINAMYCISWCLVIWIIIFAIGGYLPYYSEVWSVIYFVITFVLSWIISEMYYKVKARITKHDKLKTDYTDI